MWFKTPPYYLIDKEQGLFWSNLVPIWFDVDDSSDIPRTRGGNYIDVSYLLKYPIPSYKTLVEYFESGNVLSIENFGIIIVGIINSTYITISGANPHNEFENLTNSFGFFSLSEVTWDENRIRLKSINGALYSITITKDNKVYFAVEPR